MNFLHEFGSVPVRYVPQNRKDRIFTLRRVVEIDQRSQVAFACLLLFVHSPPSKIGVFVYSIYLYISLQNSQYHTPRGISCIGGDMHFH